MGSFAQPDFVSSLSYHVNTFVVGTEQSSAMAAEFPLGIIIPMAFNVARAILDDGSLITEPGYKGRSPMTDMTAVLSNGLRSSDLKLPTATITTVVNAIAEMANKPPQPIPNHPHGEILFFGRGVIFCSGFILLVIHRSLSVRDYGYNAYTIVKTTAWSVMPILGIIA